MKENCGRRDPWNDGILEECGSIAVLLWYCRNCGTWTILRFVVVGIHSSPLRLPTDDDQEEECKKTGGDA
jgi:hypothetical protein